MKIDTLTITIFAAGYNCDAYGESAYNECSTANPSQPTNSGGGALADTGYNVLIPIILGVAILIASLILLAKRLIRRRRSHAKN